ncbi:diacetylchitobiose ABC transporter ATP-binding protein MsiK [Pseudonocardia eucalypti]|uniref:Diacetylchitobiose ABC transporter ATP-binding protein MsiK n=1 Tax=Pseudonocardia eucalypti TaxID=648755 RepID=A0ABP9Q495_9PSEU|nr:multiple sugar transport system ATP-binding protein [Pseudonocardia eucalypti]
MAEVTYLNASRLYPGAPPVRAVDKLNLDVADGEFLVLVGPSGSGKSTALRMLAGLEEVDEGAISIGGKDVTTVAPKDRDIAMVFQSYALYPHMTVAENMAFALKLKRTPKAVITQKVKDAAAMLDLTPYLDRRPKALSGGQRQRVAMGRAIVREPSVFLMDEPLSNLDAKLRVETRANITALQTRLRTTTIYVTHDQVEAMTMGHRVAVLKDGLLQQCASPRELYDRPVNTFVAGFIGSPSMNLVDAPVTDGGVALDGLRVPLPRTTLDALGEVRVGIRPEALCLVGASDPGVELTVRLVEELGADAFVYGEALIGGEPTRLIVRTPGAEIPAFGERVRVGLRPGGRVHAFHPETGERLPD